MSESEQLYCHVLDVSHSLRHTKMRLQHHQITGDIELFASTERVVQALQDEKAIMERRLNATPITK
jgi:hypothetical protein